MHIRDAVEFLYLSRMHRWQTNAPPDHRMGLLGDTPTENSQVARLAFALKDIAVGQVEETLVPLQRLTVKHDGSSYVSKDARHMKSPYPLLKGWYLEGCTSLPQKLAIARRLRQLGRSPTFVDAVASFVANESVDRYFPTDEQLEEMIQRCERLNPLLNT